MACNVITIIRDRELLEFIAFYELFQQIKCYDELMGINPSQNKL